MTTDLERYMRWRNVSAAVQIAAWLVFLALVAYAGWKLGGKVVNG